MQRILIKILKFVFGFGLAVLFSGIVYNYFPQAWQAVKETRLFTASLTSSQNQKIEEEEVNPPKEPDMAIPMDQYMGAPQNNNREEETISYQDRLDEIAEQIDIIQREINDLILAQNPPKEEVAKEDAKAEDENQVAQEDQAIQTLPQNYSHEGGSKPIYPKILISEIQITPIEQRFVELYNPNDFEVSLDDWYLQRKTQTADSWGTFATSDDFANKKIPAHGFFLISRGLAGSNIIEDITLSENNSLALKNPNREISDLLGWGQASDFERNLAENPPNELSIGRKWENNSEKETDNNFVDFEIQNLTPKAQNLKYIAPTEDPVIPPAEKVANKILISEILLGDNEFIELYNPNSADVDLTDWSLWRKTASGNEDPYYVSKTSFKDKKILADDYFLIAREGSQYQNLAENYGDIVFDEPLTEDNSLALKNFNGEISDKLGFGLAGDFELLATVTPEDKKALARIWLDSENTEQDTDNNFNDFQIKTPTPRAKNIEPLPPEIIDTTPPSVVFNLSASQTELAFTINFEITDLLETTSSGVESYVFRWTDSDPAVEENWQQDNVVEINRDQVSADAGTEKFSGAKSFEGQDGKTYYFQIKAKDFAENESAWLPATPVQTKIELPPLVPELLPIVINEIQIDSISGSGGTDDDWITLYNSNETEVSLSGWSIQKHGKKEDSGQCLITSSFYSKSFADDSKIPPKEYFYIVSTKADDSLKLLPGMEIGWSLADNSTIYLVKSQDDIKSITDENIIDKVGFGTACSFEQSPAPVPPDGGSIKRKNSGQDINDNGTDFEIIPAKAE